MQSKSLLIAIAAFAVTATGVHAYGGTKMLGRAGLSEDQVEAIEEARELRASGKLTAARDKLANAGITEDTLASMRRVASDTRTAVYEALTDGDYTAFREVVADSPLADLITTEEDFQQFREAHELRLSGNWDAAEEMMSSMEVDGNGQAGQRVGVHPLFMGELSVEQRDAFRVAQQANDRATMQAVLDEAGVTSSAVHRGHTKLR